MKTKKIVISKHLAQRLNSLVGSYVPSGVQTVPEKTNKGIQDSVSYVRDIVAEYSKDNKIFFTKNLGEDIFLCSISDSVIFEDSKLIVPWSNISEYITKAIDENDENLRIKIEFKIPQVEIISNEVNSNIYRVNSGCVKSSENVNSFKNILSDLVTDNKISDGVTLCCFFLNAIGYWMIPKDLKRSPLNSIKFLGANIYEAYSVSNGEVQFHLCPKEKDFTHVYELPCKALLCLDCTITGSREDFRSNPNPENNLHHSNKLASGCFPLELLRRMDNIRTGLPVMKKSQFTSPSEGGVEVYAPAELPSDDYVEVPLDTPCAVKDPWELADEDSCVIIDFGTSSTVVAYRDSRGFDRLLRMSGFEKEISNDQYENPTALEFSNYENFISAWKNEKWRPLTEWENGVTSSYCAKDAIKAHPTSGVTNIKSWAKKRHNSIPLRLEDDQYQKDFELFPLPVEDCDNPKDLDDWRNRPLDPIELYGYHLGLCLNTQTIRGGSIYLNYVLTYPVKFDLETRKRIQQGLRRGLLRSMPPSLVFSDKWKDANFSVEYMASEPEALACSVLPALRIDCTFEDQPFAIFDFGGGTADFAAGIYRLSTDSEINETGAEKTIEIFGTSGDATLGGEHIINLLCYSVIKNNASVLIENKISFVLPDEDECVMFPGSETLWGKGSDSFGNLQILRNELRSVWENDQDCIGNIKTVGGLEVPLKNSNDEIKQLTLQANYEDLMKIIQDRIREGVESFYIFFLQTFYNIQDQVQKLHVIFAGNSCRTPVLKKVFSDVKDRIIGDSPEIAKMSAEFRKLIKEHYDFVDQWRNDETDCKSNETTDETSDNSPTLTLKNCVALGMLKLISDYDINLKYGSDDSQSMEEAEFDYTVGTFKNHFLVPHFHRCSGYNEWQPFAKVLAPRFRGEFNLDVGWSSDPLASSDGENIPQTGCRHKILRYSKEYTGYEICIRAVSPHKIELGCFAENSAEPVNIREINLD